MANDRKASLLDEAAEMAMNHPSKDAQAFACAVTDYLASTTGEAEPAIAARYPALKEALAADKNAAVTPAMIAAGLKATNALDPVLSTLYPNELTAVYQAMHAMRPFAQPEECTTCGALVVGVASREEAPATPPAATPVAPGDAFTAAYMAACEGRAPDHNEIGLHYFRAGAALSHPAPVAAPAPAFKPGSFLMQKIDAAAEALSEVMAFSNFGAALGLGTKVSRALSGLRGLQSAATPTPGDSADAPVQQAGMLTWVECGFDKRICHDADGKVRGQIERGMLHGRWEAFADARIGEYMTEAQAKAAVERAALKGEQPVEPSGTERGEV